MSITIKDVAALAGVSPSTVSRVVNDNPAISTETKERVRHAMITLGYEATGTPTQSTQAMKLIGVILPPSLQSTVENTFILKALRGISQFCNFRQYASTIITGKNDDEVIRAIRTLTSGGQIDGFILLYSRENDPIVDFLCEEGLLYVLIGKPHQLARQTICVDNDNLLAGREATEYLYNLGHRQIAFLGTDQTYLFTADRQAGYQLAMMQYGLDAVCVEIKDGPTVRALLGREDRPTAIVVSDDLLALTLERICIQMDISIPEDLSIISFNNSLFARLTSTPLTCVDINSFQLGYEAAAQIIKHAENPGLIATKTIVPHRIVERESCRAWGEEAHE